MVSAIEVKGLTRIFGNGGAVVRAVDNLTFSVEPGEVFGMLGHNGAGKTTLVRLINGVLDPTSGSVHVLGMDAHKQGSHVRKLTGVLTETPSLYERLTARENLRLFASLYEAPDPAKRADEMLALFKLSERANDRAGGFSKGMKQRLALARALIHDPQILFLDEPTAALDPEAARTVTDLIEELSSQRGRTVFLATHNLNEAQRLCTRVAVLSHGKLLALGTTAELGRQLWRAAWLDFDLRAPLTPEAITALKGVDAIRDLQVEGSETRRTGQRRSAHARSDRGGGGERRADHARQPARALAGRYLLRTTAAGGVRVAKGGGIMKLNWRIIWNIAVKDWKEVLQNRTALLSSVLVPVIFVVVIPLLLTVLPQKVDMTSFSNDSDFQLILKTLPPALQTEIGGMSPDQMMIVLILGYMFAPMFLIMPLMIASIIGADSIVGEKERKTLEALLYTPATDTELYLAKVLSAWLPATLIAWVSFIVYAVVTNVAGMPIMGRVWFPLPHWWALILWVAPGVAALGMLVIVMVSSRVSTFMAAQQTSGILVLPIILLVVGQASGVMYFGTELVLVLGAVVWVLDVALLWLGVKQFSRSALMARI